MAYHAPLGGLSVGKTSSYTFPPVLRPEKLMLSGGSGCDPITSSPLNSPHLWESRPTHLKVWRPPRPFRYCNAAGWSTHLTFVRFLTKICEPLLALLFSCHSCALHTKQGFASQAAQISRFPKASRHSSSSRRGTSQVTYVTMVPRGNETLRCRAILPASLL